MKAIILDTETTGIDAPEMIEAGWLAIDVAGEMLDVGYEKRFRPSKPISMGALATHHILDEDLAGCDPPSSFALPVGTEYVIGHNIDFDWTVLGKPDVKRICTLAMSRALWPESDSHSLGAMLYLLERKRATAWLRDAHSALADVFMCLRVLQHINAKAGPFASFEEMWQASERMRIPTVMTFGKHKGVAIAKVPADYKRWYCGTPDADPYLVKAMRAA